MLRILRSYRAAPRAAVSRINNVLNRLIRTNHTLPHTAAALTHHPEYAVEGRATCTKDARVADYSIEELQTAYREGKCAATAVLLCCWGDVLLL